jgi:hypothetical protein
LRDEGAPRKYQACKDGNDVHEAARVELVFVGLGRFAEGVPD